MPSPSGDDDDAVNVIGYNSACPPQLSASAVPTGGGAQTPSMLCSYGVVKNVSKL